MDITCEVCFDCQKTGPRGPTGMTGKTGFRGLTGVTGPMYIGHTGITGVTGITGTTGSTGPTGPTGPTGAGPLTIENIYNSDGVLTGNRIVNLNNNTLTFIGNVVIDGKLNVTGLIDPTGLILTNYNSSGIPTNINHGSFYVADGTDTQILGHPIYKDPSGNLFDLLSVFGVTGKTGAIGVTGALGETGSMGMTGDTGNTGITGNKGVTGDIGLLGNTGITGKTGQTGNTGRTGNKGNTGNSGDTGSKGRTGDTGSQGLTGNIGIIGTTGIIGATGATGATGNVGITGIGGVTGTTGAGRSQVPILCYSAGNGVTGLTGNFTLMPLMSYGAGTFTIISLYNRNVPTSFQLRSKFKVNNTGVPTTINATSYQEYPFTPTTFTVTTSNISIPIGTTYYEVSSDHYFDGFIFTTYIYIRNITTGETAYTDNAIGPVVPSQTIRLELYVTSAANVNYRNLIIINNKT